MTFFPILLTIVTSDLYAAGITFADSAFTGATGLEHTSNTLGLLLFTGTNFSGFRK